MSCGSTPDSFIRLLTTFSIKIEAPPDDLKCIACKSVLKSAYQVVPCGCRFCHTCVDNVMSSGAMFCPGSSEKCDETYLLTAHQDSMADYSIGKLTARCPMAGCSHECPLVYMEGHLLVCPKKIENHAFREHNELPSQDMSGHLQQENRNSEVLIGMVDNMKRDMEIMKHELELKDKQMRMIMKEMKHVLNENVSIKDENKSIKRENESIKDENKSIKRENESIKDKFELLKRENEVLASNRDAVENEVEPIEDDNRSINRANSQSVEDEIDSLNVQVQSTGEPAGLGRVDPSCYEWVIESDVSDWDKGSLPDMVRAFSPPLTSAIFTGSTHPYTYQLVSRCHVRWGILRIWLRIIGGPHDSLLEWPFRGAVTVTVSQRDKRERRISQMKQCQIERPSENQYRKSDAFLFVVSELIKAGLELCNGICVSCQIIPVRTSDTESLASSTRHL